MKWRTTLLPVFFDLAVFDPRYIESHGNRVSRNALENNFLIATSEEDVIRFYERYIRMGFTHVAAAPSGDVDGFLQDLGKAAKYLRGTYADEASALPYRGSYTRDNLNQFLKNQREKCKLSESGCPTFRRSDESQSRRK